MKEELITRVEMKRPATKPGCCMWSPILPIDRSSDADGAVDRTRSEGAGSIEARREPLPSGAVAETALES